jgi:hypothetical protein
VQTWEAGLLATTAEDPPDAVGGEGPARPRFLHQCCNPIATTSFSLPMMLALRLAGDRSWRL